MLDDALSRAEQVRPFGTCFPEGGDPNRYTTLTNQIGRPLYFLDRELEKIAKLGEVTLLSDNLLGRFQYGRFLRLPTDTTEFASYFACWSACTAQSGLSRTNTRAGSRLWNVRDKDLWSVATARMLTFQMCSHLGKTPKDNWKSLLHGVKLFLGLSVEARFLAQALALYVVGLFQEPGAIDPARLQNLVGTSVPIVSVNLAGKPICLKSLSLVLKSVNAGQHSLKEIIHSDGILRSEHLLEAVDYLVDGSFNMDLGVYDHIPTADDPHLLARYRVKGGPHHQRLNQLKAFPVVQAYYAIFDLNGDGKVTGPELQPVLSSIHDLLNLMLSGASPSSDAPAVVKRHFENHNPQGDGLYPIEDIRRFLRNLRPVLESIKLDQPALAKMKVPYGPVPLLEEQDRYAADRCPFLYRLFRETWKQELDTSESS